MGSSPLLTLTSRAATALATGLAILALAGCSPESNEPRPAPPSKFVLLDGSTVQTADLRGKVTLVNFWATSCTVCVADMPHIAEIHRAYAPRGFDTLAVAMRYDPPSYVVHYAQTRNLPFKVAIDNMGTAAQEWGPVEATPTTFVLNRNAEIVARFVGEPDFSKLRALIEDLLVERPPHRGRGTASTP